MNAENKLTDTIEACRYCPMCRHVCSSEFLSYRESDTPRGRAMLLYPIYMGDSKYYSSVIDAIYNCFLCGCCLSWCAGKEEGGYDIPALIKETRVDIVKKGLAPDAAVDIKDSILKNGNPYGLDISKSLSAGMEEKKAKAFYYMGTDVNFRNKEIAKAFINILEKLNEDFTTLKDEISGAKVLFILGFENEAKKRAQKLFEKIKKIGCSIIIISDPLDFDFIRNDMKNFGFDLGASVKIVHVSQYLDKKIKDKSLVLKNINKKVCLVDSEYLGRFNGIYDEPRDILKRSAGKNLVELQWSREKMLSAGEAAFIFQSKIFDRGKDLGEKICKMAREKKTNIIVTLSATAKNNIKGACKDGVRVLDLVEFVDENI